MTDPKLSALEHLQPKKPCGKVVNVSKYERTNPDVQDWWRKLFQKLEESHTVPFYKRETNLEKCFSTSALRKLKQIGVEVQTEDKDDFITYKENDMFISTKKDNLSNEFLDDEMTEPKHATNPYANFLRKSKERAQIWRPTKEPSLADLKLMDKAHTATDRIATQFDKWVKNMGGKTTTTINKKVILELFEIGFNYPAATSLCLRTRLLNCVPDSIANATKHPEFSCKKAIWREIEKDINANKETTQNVVFGKTLPMHLRRKPIKEGVRDKWTKTKMKYQDLESMEIVFKDILDMQATYTFCKWMLKNPMPNPPQYLVDNGLLNEDTLEAKIAAKILQDIDYADDPLKIKMGILEPMNRNTRFKNI